MRYFGVHPPAADPLRPGHDAGLAVFDGDGRLEFCASLERLSRARHDGGPVSRIWDYLPDAPVPAPGDLVAYPHPGCPVRSPQQHDVLVVGHHAAHAACSWLWRPDDRPRKYLAYDGWGHAADGRGVASQVGTIGPAGLVEGETDLIPSSSELSYPLGFGGAGKLMGLAGYYHDQPPRRPWLLTRHRRPSTRVLRKLAGFYRWHVEEIWRAIEPLLDGPVVIGGGTALALELNSRILERAGEVVFGPPVDDSGLALGAAALGYHAGTGRWPILDRADLLDCPPLRAVGPQRPDDLARILADGFPLGLLRGRPEIGPRALGHRSLLARPCRNALARVSIGLKGREHYRPLAPVVTDREFDRLFRGPRGRWMQYRVECTDQARELVPGVVHRDGSSRPQVVEARHDPWLYDLLAEFGKLYGVECLVNTSLNGRGMPICHTAADAMADFGGRLMLASIRGT